VLQKIFVVPAQQASAGCRLPERVTVAVCQRRAELALLAEVGAQPAGLEPEPRVVPAERFDAVQSLAPAAWQEVEPEPSVSERWY